MISKGLAPLTIRQMLASKQEIKRRVARNMYLVYTCRNIEVWAQLFKL